MIENDQAPRSSQITESTQITDSPVDPYEDMSDNEIGASICENKFNAILINLFDHITLYYPDIDEKTFDTQIKNDESFLVPTISSFKEQLDSIMMESPSGPICCFMKYVYINNNFRKNMLDMNENFFDNFEESTNDVNGSTIDYEKDKLVLKQIFCFGKLWKRFDYRTKYFIMKSFKGMTKITTKYIGFLD